MAKIQIADQKALNPATAGSSQEYTRQAAFEPSHRVSGIGQAFGAASAASDASAAIGASIASDLALENARATGMKMGQTNPGVEPLPAFTKSDKAFVEAYRQEEHNTVTYNGTKFLQDAAQIVHQDPTPANLVQFQKNSESTLGNLVSQTTEFNRSNVKRSLSSQYQAQFHSLSNAVEARNRKIMADNFKASSSLNQENIITAGYSRNYAALQQSYDDEITNIAHAINTDTIGKEEAQTRRQSLNIQEAVARNVGPLMQAEKEGVGDSFLDNFVKTPYPAYSPMEKEAIGQQLYKTLHTQRQLTAGQQQINYTRAMGDIKSNNLSPTFLDDIRGEVSGLQYANIEGTLQEKFAKDMEKVQTFNNIAKNVNDPGSLANFSQKDKNEYFQSLVTQAGNQAGHPLSLLEQAEIAGQIKAPLTQFSDGLSNAIVSGSPPQAAEAAAAAYALGLNDSPTATALSSQSQAIASRYNALAEVGVLPTQAIQQAREEILQTKDATRWKELDDNYAFETGSKGMNFGDPLVLGNFVADELGFGDALVPVGINAKYKELLKHNFYQANGNMNAAKDMTNRQMRQAYHVTYMNGTPEVSFAAIEHTVAHGGMGRILYRAQMVDELHTVFEEQKRSFNDKQSSYYYEFGQEHGKGFWNNFFTKLKNSGVSNPEEKDYEATGVNSPVIQKELPLKVRKFERDNNGYVHEVKGGEIVVRADAFTTLPKDGINPSYVLQFQQDGIPSTLWNPRNQHGSVRFTPNPEKVKEVYGLTDEKLEILSKRVMAKRGFFNKLKGSGKWSEEFGLVGAYVGSLLNDDEEIDGVKY